MVVGCMDGVVEGRGYSSFCKKKDVDTEE